MKWIASIFLSLVILWIAACTGLYWLMTRPPEQFARGIAKLPGVLMLVSPFESLWTQARTGELHPGESAPEFELPVLGANESVRLSSLRGRPVMLVFGSYT